jgi:hypothetical protein
MSGTFKSNSHGLSNHGKEGAKKTSNSFLLLLADQRRNRISNTYSCTFQASNQRTPQERSLLPLFTPNQGNAGYRSCWVSILRIKGSL